MYFRSALLAACYALAFTSCEPAPRDSHDPAAGTEAADEGFPSALPAAQQVELGRQLFLRSRLDSAATVLESALEAARTVQDRQAESDALAWWASSLFQSGDLAEAERRARDSSELKLRYDLTNAWRPFNVLGLVAWWQSRNTDAVDLYRRALEVADDDPEGVATVGSNLALVLFEFGDFAGARAGFEAMRDYGRGSGESRLEGNALINLAMLDVQIGDPYSAVPKLERARVLQETAGSITGVEFAVGHLGTAYAAMGELGRAYAAFDTALVITRENGLRAQEAQNLSQLAGLHAAAEDRNRALDLYAEAREINEKIGLEDRVATDLREEAILLAALGNLPEARRRAEEAWSIHERVEARLEAERDLLVLAELAHQDGDRETAEEYLVGAWELADRIGARVARAEVALVAARIADRAAEPQRVLEILEIAEDDLGESDYATEWEAEALRARAYLRLGRLEEAEASGRRAVEVTERVRRGFASGVLQSSYATARLETYATLVNLLLQQGHVEDVLQVADAARGRGLGAHLASQTNPASPGSAAAVLAQGERILRRIDNLVESMDPYLNDPSPQARETAGELGLRIAQARGDYERHLIRRAELQGQREDILGIRSVRADDIQDALEEGEVLLEYLITPEWLSVFVITNSELRVAQRNISVENLTSRIRLAREFLAQPDAGGREGPVLERLYELVVDPAMETGLLADADRIIVVPHEALTYLPLAALRDPSTGRYLVEDFSLIHAPSAAAFVALQKRASSSGPAALGAVLAPFPDALLASREEALAVAQQLGAQPILGMQATESALRQALEGSGPVHVATHGIMNPLNPMFSRIELQVGEGGPSDDGRLEVHEVLELRIGAELVFLSGCETGLGATWSTDFVRGEDYTTLAQAFLFAGAGSVVASLWRLEDPGAARFAEFFYRELERHAPADALAMAQRAMMSDPSYASPFYWAAYQLAGSS